MASYKTLSGKEGIKIMYKNYISNKGYKLVPMTAQSKA